MAIPVICRYEIIQLLSLLLGTKLAVITHFSNSSHRCLALVAGNCNPVSHRRRWRPRNMQLALIKHARFSATVQWESNNTFQIQSENTHLPLNMSRVWLSATEARELSAFMQTCIHWHALVCNSFTVALFTLFLSSKKLEFCKSQRGAQWRQAKDWTIQTSCIQNLYKTEHHMVNCCLWLILAGLLFTESYVCPRPAGTCPHPKRYPLIDFDMTIITIRYKTSRPYMMHYNAILWTDIAFTALGTKCIT